MTVRSIKGRDNPFLSGYWSMPALKNARKDNLWILWITMFATMAIHLLLMTVIVREELTEIWFYVELSDICTTILHLYGTYSKFVLLYLLLERFKHLNREIVPNVSWDEKCHGSNAIKILDVKILHSMLYDAQQAFCDMYSIPLLAWFASLMIHIVANLSFFRERPLIVACALVCPAILQVLILCMICHFTAEEANNIACILSEDMCTLVNSGETMVKIDAFTYFLHNQISFEAAGFFNIDLPLFQSVSKLLFSRIKLITEILMMAPFSDCRIDNYLFHNINIISQAKSKRKKTDDLQICPS
ncbi:PREDICTED: uncharacterized protein LOC106746617 [Dinoponera quadriceps]|uniref:Gustatory receptor n=1 Tax=Dinoponera quadriceps TaxID=609295 RepID=A0A6P3XK86_DINQU|nr:PREDICTED: uncharacterized protein LOC106746617 [Dinoponera quadriceps]